MRALEIITSHVMYNPVYTYKFQLKTTIVCSAELVETGVWAVYVARAICNVHSISTQTRQEGMECTNAKLSYSINCPFQYLWRMKETKKKIERIKMMVI